MGSFLDKPVTNHVTHAEEGNGLKAGLSCMQGWRVDMEDAHTITIKLTPDRPDYSWFAVYDGHGGAMVAKQAAVKMLGALQASDAWKADSMSTESLVSAFKQGFLALDAELRQHPDVESGEDHSGSTAITCLVTPTHFIVGNAGDSRAILVRGGAAVALSEDHKPYNPQEEARIIKAGGTVSMRRVNGDLAVSRALGDYVYKQPKEMKPEEYQVSPEPDVLVLPRSEGDDQFLCLACDGVWDVMSNEEVAKFLLERAGEGMSDPVQLSGALINEGLRLNSRDNMSALIVALNGAPVVSPSEADQRKKEREAREAAAAAASNAAGGGAVGGMTPLAPA